MKNVKKLFEYPRAIAEDNFGFIESLYENFLSDPNSVDASWRERFSDIQSEPEPSVPSVARHRDTVASGPSDDIEARLRKQAAVDRLIQAYRSRGHLIAGFNPLKTSTTNVPKDLEFAAYGLTQDDLDQEFYFDILSHSRRMSLRDILETLRKSYCGSIAVEYMHIVDSEINSWLRHRIEGQAMRTPLNDDSKRLLLQKLTAAEGIERYLHRKYVGQKRFSLEGAESLIPLLDEAINKAAASTVREVVIGMAHRGRLNVLVNILGKKPGSLFQEFEGIATAAGSGTGDVKYHQGFSSDIETPSGSVHLALAFNPSHLEIVNPVVEGSVRARQDRRDGTGEDEVMAVLIHGDAAFAGQGVVMETLNMAETRAYTTGGTVHVVINNQIGFTTSNPFDARSTLYCTDVAYMVQAPVLHVNGDDPEAVLAVSRLAVEYRMKFKRDIVIDMVCYRRHGHNEADEPAVTQPTMYQFIRQHATVRKIYADRLVEDNVLTRADEQAMEESYLSALKQDEVVSRPIAHDQPSYIKNRWSRYLGQEWNVAYESGNSVAQLQETALQLLDLPSGFNLHGRTRAILDDRRKMAEGEIPMDWGFAENLAYASLIRDGYNVRLTGQDVGRGTFFHRHAVLHEQETGTSYVPLQNISGAKGHFHIYDSLLSEEGVLGFEYGYASTDPETLVIWEAQFGDFANGAQVLIDQFITSGETKWGRLCGLTMLLPHGYEGQGPEHSSARIERYLQMCAEQNIQVCMPTTPAQIFHLLRRQMVRAFRKPLVVFSPKSLLRHKLAVSTLEELEQGGFRNLIGEIDPHDAAAITRVVLCGGKVFYDLLETRRRQNLAHVAIIRIEQIYPFPIDEFMAELALYSNLEELVWCQEEPENQGAWHQIKHRFPNILEPHIRLGYAGRPMSAAPSVGHFHRHLEQQKQLVEDALFGLTSHQVNLGIVNANRNQRT